MELTPNRRAERSEGERWGLQEAESELEQLAESLGEDLSEFYYPFENNVEFADISTDEPTESQEALKFEENERFSVPSTPPSSPTTKPEEPEGDPDTAEPTRDRRPATLSRRAWHKLRRVVERQERADEEASKPKLYDEVTGRLDQSREAEEARDELCGHHDEKEAQPSLSEEGTRTALHSSRSTALHSSSSLSEAMPPQASLSEGTQRGCETVDELQKGTDVSPTAPSTRKCAVSSQDEQLEESKEQKPPEGGSNPGGAVSCPDEELHRAKEKPPLAPPTRRNSVSWHPVAEVVTVEAESPTTQVPVARILADLVEKSTLRSCRRISGQANVQLGTSSSSSTSMPK